MADNVFNKIPQDLPITDPLLFSFLMILDAVKFDIRMDGTEKRDNDSLPAFQYAVNRWRTIKSDSEDRGTHWRNEFEVICAIWTRKPEKDDQVVWGKHAGGTERVENQRPIDMTFKYSFEQWKQDTFWKLDQIVQSLVSEGPNRVAGQKMVYLKDIFGWEILNDSITYVYAADKTADQHYGVGATFTLIGDYSNCCPVIDQTNLTLSFFQSLGYKFPE